MSNKHAREVGQIKYWNAAGGYGFIRIATHEARETYFHISDFVSDSDPCVGDRVSFIERAGRDGKPRAISVMPAAI
jgi:cold shock CspA family protein